jgi:hypothetical protein
VTRYEVSVSGVDARRFVASVAGGRSRDVGLGYKKGPSLPQFLAMEMEILVK